MNWRDRQLDSPHRKLEVWELGMKLVRQVYRLTSEFPEDERFGLVSQLRRAAVSIPSNVAEGSARRTSGDYLRFLYDARGSVVEVDTQLELAHQLGYLDGLELESTRETFESLSRALQGLINHLE
ncbi:MAG: four helix bundle protein [Bradymonadaceae bacterium]